MTHSGPWPALPLAQWQGTYDSLHLWTQVVGKIRMALSPPQNHFWHVTLYINARGLTTGPIPCGEELFEIQFDFLAHTLDIHAASGERRVLPLRAESVALFYARVMDAMSDIGVTCTIQTKPQEIPNAIPFEQDQRSRFLRWRICAALVANSAIGRSRDAGVSLRFRRQM